MVSTQTKEHENMHITLEQFILLKDPFNPEQPLGHLQRGRIAPSGDIGEDIMLRYKIAVASIKRYGEDGPPVGTKVITLVDGHGGGAGCVREFMGVNENDQRFFSLLRNDYGNDSISLAYRKLWWVQFVAAHMVEQNRSGLSFKDYS